MSYIDEIIERVSKENPTEPEFHNLNAAVRKHGVAHNYVAGFGKVVDAMTAQGIV